MRDRLTYLEIVSLQKQYGVGELQNQINNGSIWKFEGSVGRFASEMLEWGVVMLPKKPTFNYYGTRIPTRIEVKPGTKGSFQKCEQFWLEVKEGDIEKIDALYETFN